MNPVESMKKQLAWLDATAHQGRALLDIAIGDAEKREGAFFLRAGHSGLTTKEIIRKSGFYRATNSVGIRGKVERGLNIYIKSSPEAQSWLMLDDLSIDQCLRVARNRTNMIIETSPGKHHLWLATNRTVSIDERKVCQQILQSNFGGDAKSVDGSHFGRVCGFKSIKRNCWVNLITAVVAERRADVDQLLSHAESNTLSPLGGCVSSLPQAKKLEKTVTGRDESSEEFGWAVGWLKTGLDLEEGIQRLTKKAADRNKPYPEKYARLTFQEASKCA